VAEQTMADSQKNQQGCLAITQPNYPTGYKPQDQSAFLLPAHVRTSHVVNCCCCSRSGYLRLRAKVPAKHLPGTPVTHTDGEHELTRASAPTLAGLYPLLFHLGLQGSICRVAASPENKQPSFFYLLHS